MILEFLTYKIIETGVVLILECTTPIVQESSRKTEKVLVIKARRKIKMNGYIAMYRGKSKEIYAETSYEAQKLAAELFKAKKAYEVIVVLAEKDGKQVVHRPAF